MFEQVFPFGRCRVRGARLALLSVALAAAPLVAAGQPATAPAPSVDELVARALANAPSIGARRERLAAAQASLPAADAPPDPMIEFEWRQGGFPKWTLGSDPMSMVGGSYRQQLLSKGRKTTRRAAAEADIDVRREELDQTACDLTMAVWNEYSRLYAIDQERTILRDAEEMARLLAETATSRYASGGSDQASVLRAQLERTRLSERDTDLAGERTMTVAALNRLLNQPPETPIGEVRALPEPPALPGTLAAMPARAASAAPEVAVRQAQVTAAAKRVDAARADAKPTWSLGGSVFWQGNTDRVVAFTAGVEWPLRKSRRQQPMIEASERELAAARFDLADTAATMQADAARMTADITRIEEQITRYRSGLLPQSSAALDAARASYLGGRGEFASVIDEFRRWTDIRVELAQREAARFAARGQLEILVNPVVHGAAEHHVTPTDTKKEPS